MTPARPPFMLRSPASRDAKTEIAIPDRRASIPVAS